MPDEAVVQKNIQVGVFQLEPEGIRIDIDQVRPDGRGLQSQALDLEIPRLDELGFLEQLGQDDRQRGEQE